VSYEESKNPYYTISFVFEKKRILPANDIGSITRVEHLLNIEYRFNKCMDRTEFLSFRRTLTKKRIARINGLVPSLGYVQPEAVEA